MITRPLDLSGRLQPAPRSFDALFYVNVGLLVFFFSLFGSRFVLAPGLGVDFQLPEMAGATAGARPTTHQISVRGAGQILADDGVVSIKQLSLWLEQQRAMSQHPATLSLLVLASREVPHGKLVEITSVARQAGFAVVWGALELKDSGEGSGR